MSSVFGFPPLLRGEVGVPVAVMTRHSMTVPRSSCAAQESNSQISAATNHAEAAASPIRNDALWEFGHAGMAYIRWFDDAVRGLSEHLPRSEIDRLVRTANSWRVLGLPDDSVANILAVVKPELQERIEGLEAAALAGSRWPGRGR